MLRPLIHIFQVCEQAVQVSIFRVQHDFYITDRHTKSIGIQTCDYHAHNCHDYHVILSETASLHLVWKVQHASRDLMYYVITFPWKFNVKENSACTFSKFRM